ncbi:glycerol kinase GlpK [Ferrimicrobium sp.]|uniref:glycerol kinase GlpK n=1 Tax=Ferrimicrobium sp. TaxID=2926050 RepID=UPI0026287742|nr:glycerol kinase GlpK [Ferrimicrobium sp.]
MTKYILALDQGTTSSRAILFNDAGLPVAVGQQEFRQIYPQPGWVEHDPEEIWQSEWQAIQSCLKSSGVDVADIAAVGITNQRETTVVWNRHTGQAVYNAIVWQCRRTAGMCDRLREAGHTDMVRAKTGLVIDAYFSGTKVAWILDNVPGARELAEKGDLVFGTIDSWLINKLTHQKLHVTDYSNASRTMIYNIGQLDWDDELLQLLNIPRSMCPTVVDSSGVVGEVDESWLGRKIPIAGIAGDQQAALFGQGCYTPGTAKNTYGTGSFLLMNTGDAPVMSENGLVTTLAWGIDHKVTYALEGSIFITGAVVQWLRDELGLIKTADETEAMALSVPDTGGVYLVPAFVGLGAPWWDSYARGTIVGLTRGSNRAHIARAALESIAYQSRDVLEAMRSDSKQAVDVLRVDGGAINNSFLAQFQADILGVRVERPKVTETTAMGAAFLAGLAVGVWDGFEPLTQVWQRDALFYPSMVASRRDELVAGWVRAVERSKSWAEQ